jgi:hypothetical protein
MKITLLAVFIALIALSSCRKPETELILGRWYLSEYVLNGENIDGYFPDNDSDIVYCFWSKIKCPRFELLKILNWEIGYENKMINNLISKNGRVLTNATDCECSYSTLYNGSLLIYYSWSLNSENTSFVIKNEKNLEYSSYDIELINMKKMVLRSTDSNGDLHVLKFNRQ